MADDLTRWLRAVRPPTAADDEWPESAEVLAGIHRATSRGPGARPRARLSARWLVPAVTTMAAAAVVVVVTAVGGGGEPTRVAAPPDGSRPVLPFARPAAMLLSSFSSCDGLLEGLRKHAAANVSANWLPDTSLYSYYRSSSLSLGGPMVDFNSATFPMPAGAASALGQQPSTSTTNVQEAGVDEPDIVKTDGDRVITVTDGVLRVVDDAAHNVTGSLDLTTYDGWETAQLLVSGNSALVIMTTGYQAYTGPGLYAPRAPANIGSTLLFVDLVGLPQVTGSMRMSGGYLDARQVGTTVRLVATSAPRITLPYVHGDRDKRRAAYQTAVQHAPLAAWLPTYSIARGGSDTGRMSVPCTSVSHPAKYTAASMLTVYTLDLSDLGADPNPVSVAADGDTVYATDTSLYVASNPGYCCGGSGPTELHRFDISGSGPPSYLGSGSVPGRLLNRYSLSEYDGTLRVATTTGNEGSSSSSGVYALNAATLTITGHVDHLGDGERIYAVRFLGPMAYVVTYHQVDPLYVVDLHDPAAPKLTGRLDMTGYSVYLHDAGDGRLLGVGQETSGGQGRGTQVSLYDVSEPSDPSRTGQVVVPKTIESWDFDPHSFLYWQPTGLVVVPIRSWSHEESGEVIVLKVSGPTLTRVGTVANPVDIDTPDDGMGIQRSMVVDGDLWTVSGSGIQVSNPSSLDQHAWIPFPTP